MVDRVCRRHGREHPCSCAMGNLYRFVEPVLLFLLQKKGQAYGYELASEIPDYALTDAEIERAALYRTLRHLERNGNVTSEWMSEKRGPARRIYRITAKGERHLSEWITVLAHMSKSMTHFVREARGLQADSPALAAAGSGRWVRPGTEPRPVKAHTERGGTRAPGRGSGN